MAAFDYRRPLATANRLIERFGQLGAVSRKGPNLGTLARPEYGPPDLHPARFVVTNFQANEIDGTHILSTDKKVLMSVGSLTIEPTSDDGLVEANGATWKIIPPVRVLRPAETTLLFTLQVRN